MAAGPPVSGYMSRADLEGLIARTEGALRSPAYSEPLKTRARAQEAEARARLEAGDFGRMASVQVVTRLLRSLAMRPTGTQGVDGCPRAEVE